MDGKMQLRTCYDSSGKIIGDRKIQDYQPLQKLLDMFGSLRDVNSPADDTVPVFPAGSALHTERGQ
ncbi:MAG: hypothetical protein IK990_01155 [Ruminiclostridium sp.]|nr:hypothetical protein [Ruminiclostridium sp.]